MINNDDSNWNADDDNGDQTITIFQKMHFGEPEISEKSKFLALTHVSVYGYWCFQVTTLSAYNASVMFLLHSYQSIMPCYNVFSP